MTFRPIEFREGGKSHPAHVSIRKPANGAPMVYFSFSIDLLERCGVKPGDRVIPLLGVGPDEGTIRFKRAKYDESARAVKAIKSSYTKGKVIRGLISVRPWMDISRAPVVSTTPCHVLTALASHFDIEIPPVIRALPVIRLVG